MRTLRYIVLALLFLLLATIVVGFLLPSKVYLERSVVIKRDIGQIFKVVNSLNSFNKWSPWYDENIKYAVEGPNSGAGSAISWAGNNKIEIIESKENIYVKSKFSFGKSDQPHFSTISLIAKENVTVATWRFENNFGYNVFYRYFGFIMEDMIAPTYEKGMLNLKVYIESQPQ